MIRIYLESMCLRRFSTITNDINLKINLVIPVPPGQFYNHIIKHDKIIKRLSSMILASLDVEIVVDGICLSRPNKDLLLFVEIVVVEIYLPRSNKDLLGCNDSGDQIVCVSQWKRSREILDKVPKRGVILRVLT